MNMGCVYLRNDVLYFHAQSQTTEGAWIATPPFIRIALYNKNSSEKRISQAVATILTSSSKGVSHPTEWNVLTPLYELANVASWREFTSPDCKLVRIEADSSMQRIIPQLNQYADGGFVDTGQVIELAKTARITLPDLQRAFSFCNRERTE